MKRTCKRFTFILPFQDDALVDSSVFEIGLAPEREAVAAGEEEEAQGRERGL